MLEQSTQQFFWAERGVTRHHGFVSAVIKFWEKKLKPFLVHDLNNTLAFPYTLHQIAKLQKKFEKLAEQGM